jgi:hypothetical protein
MRQVSDKHTLRIALKIRNTEDFSHANCPRCSRTYTFEGEHCVGSMLMIVDVCANRVPRCASEHWRKISQYGEIKVSFTARSRRQDLTNHFDID